MKFYSSWQMTKLIDDPERMISCMLYMYIYLQDNNPAGWMVVRKPQATNLKLYIVWLNSPPTFSIHYEFIWIAVCCLFDVKSYVPRRLFQLFWLHLAWDYTYISFVFVSALFLSSEIDKTHTPQSAPIIKLKLFSLIKYHELGDLTVL